MAFRPRPGAKNKRKKSRRQQEAPRIRGPRIKLEDIDYKDVGLLQRLVSAQGKLFSRKRTGLDATGQRRITQAIKRARHMALMPYVS
ncbi:MAG: 30S ribosomal protein S18 [Planctomycetes bacterium]|nr:30S ribosomal protein S18 [Planctomycetota bacterium]